MGVSIHFEIPYGYKREYLYLLGSPIVRINIRSGSAIASGVSNELATIDVFGQMKYLQIFEYMYLRNEMLDGGGVGWGGVGGGGGEGIQNVTTCNKTLFPFICL